MTWAEFWAAILPPILTLFAVLLTVAIGIATKWLRTRFGIEVEAKHREALHSALMSGVNLMLARYSLAPGAPVPDALRAELAGGVVKYAVEAVPDAIRAFRLDDAPERLADLALGKLAAVLGSAAVAVTAGGTAGPA